MPGTAGHSPRHALRSSIVRRSVRPATKDTHTAAPGPDNRLEWLCVPPDSRDRNPHGKYSRHDWPHFARSWQAGENDNPAKPPGAVASRRHHHPQCSGAIPTCLGLYRPGNGVVGDACSGRVRPARVNSYRSVDPIASPAKRLSPTCAFQRARGRNPAPEAPRPTGSPSDVTVSAAA